MLMQVQLIREVHDLDITEIDGQPIVAWDTLRWGARDAPWHTSASSALSVVEGDPDTVRLFAFTRDPDGHIQLAAAFEVPFSAPDRATEPSTHAPGP